MSQKVDNLFIPVAKPNITNEVLTSVNECLQSGWLASGPRVRQFERDLGEYLDLPKDREVIAVNSATSGLFAALIACGVTDGSEVITTPFSFVATAHAIMYAQAKPVFVDIDYNTNNIDSEKIEAVINEKTKAIIPVHFAGLSVNLDKIYEIAKKHNLRVIEDAAHAIGAKYKNQKIGSFGDIQVFSFHPCKNMTSGEGGAIVADKLTIEKLKKLRFFGMQKDTWSRENNTNSSIDVLELGYKFNMSDLQASIGIPQLKILDQMNEQRKKLVSWYIEKLTPLKGIIDIPEFEYQNRAHAWHLFTIKLRNNMNNIRLIQQAKEQYNIAFAHHYPAIHLLQYYRKQLNHDVGDFPNTEKVSKNIISLPLFPQMSFAEQDRILAALFNLL